MNLGFSVSTPRMPFPILSPKSHETKPLFEIRKNTFQFFCRPDCGKFSSMKNIRGLEPNLGE